MHGGRELIRELNHEPPMFEEPKQQGDGDRVRGTVTEFKRPGMAPVVQEEAKNDTVIPFRVQNDKGGREGTGGRQVPGRRAPTPKAIDERG